LPPPRDGRADHAAIITRRERVHRPETPKVRAVLPKAIGFNELDQSTHYSKVSGYTCTGVGIGGGELHFAERPKIFAACAVARISPRAPSRTICYAALTRFLRAMGKFACVCLLA
jgi:hypothetical protein